VSNAFITSNIQKLEQIIIFEYQKALYDHLIYLNFIKKKTENCKFKILKIVNQIKNQLLNITIYFR